MVFKDLEGSNTTLKCQDTEVTWCAERRAEQRNRTQGLKTNFTNTHRVRCWQVLTWRRGLRLTSSKHVDYNHVQP
ncbi:hypothetical protein ACRRTK_019044 [Alexandromys fortis]